MSPTARTIQKMRKDGYMIGVVERFNRFGGKFGVRHDLYNLFDALACKPGEGIIGVQCGSGSDHQKHKTKICEGFRANTDTWLNSGGRIQIWSWRKLKVKRGGKAIRWEPIVEEIDLSICCHHLVRRD